MRDIEDALQRLSSTSADGRAVWRDYLLEQGRVYVSRGYLPGPGDGGGYGDDVGGYGDGVDGFGRGGIGDGDGDGGDGDGGGYGDGDGYGYGDGGDGDSNAGGVDGDGYGPALRKCGALSEEEAR